MKKLNNKGSILLIAMVILYILLGLAINFTVANLNELNNARRYYHGLAAFWLAEAGINMYMNNPFILDGFTEKTFDYGQGTITLFKDESRPMIHLVNAIGHYGQMKRHVQLTYLANVPEIYKNVISTPGNISIDGSKTSAIINGQVRLSQTVGGSSTNANVQFENIAENVDPILTSTNVTDFATFKANNKALLDNFSAQEVLYLKTADTHTLNLDEIKGKRIVYVESDEGQGDIVINSNTLVQPNQQLTVISTGTVTFNQAGIQPSNAQLNIIAWGGYNESVHAPSVHRGLIYTHGLARFDQILDSSVTNGGIIAEKGVIFGDIWSTKVFNFADMTANGFYPVGFERIASGSVSGVEAKPTLWKEIKD